MAVTLMILVALGGFKGALAMAVRDKIGMMSLPVIRKTIAFDKLGIIESPGIALVSI